MPQAAKPKFGGRGGHNNNMNYGNGFNFGGGRGHRGGRGGRGQNQPSQRGGAQSTSAGPAAPK